MSSPSVKPDGSGYVDPYADPLTGAIGRNACEDLIKSYPRVVRSSDDPAQSGQEFAIVSFNVFDPPKKTANGQILAGFFKVRGVGSEQQVKQQAIKLIKETDSINKIRLCHTGRWFPLTQDDTFVKDTVEVHTDSEETLFQTEARQKLQEEMGRKRSELMKRVEDVKNEKDIRDTPQTLEYYTLRRVTEFTIVDAIREKEREIEELRTSLRENHNELLKLEVDHPEYDEQWVAEYNKKRAESRIAPWKPKEGQFKDLENSRKERKERK